MTQPAPVPTAPLPGDPAPAPTEPTSTPPPSPAAADPADQPLGPAGQRALAAERARVKEMEKRLNALAPLEQLAVAMAGGQPQPGGPSEVELLQQRFAELEKTATEERAARWRLEVAQAKSLTAEQAAWLQGSTQEELAASADRLLAAFPAAPTGPRTPAPDPSQGARGGQPGPDLQAQVEAAKARGDILGALALERSKLLKIPRPS